MSRRLLLWRHGRTQWNADGRFQGQLDPPLDSTGTAQAAAAAEVLAGLRPTVVWTSDLQRAARTAAALAERAGLVVVPDPRLREIHLGAWQGLTREEARSRFPDEFDAWWQGSDVRRGGGGESYAEVADRAAAAAEDALATVDDGGLAVVVVHGGTARALIGRLLELPQESWWRMAPLGNCCWSVLVEADNGWRLAEHGVSVQERAEILPAPDVEPATSGF